MYISALIPDTVLSSSAHTVKKSRFCGMGGAR